MGIRGWQLGLGLLALSGCPDDDTSSESVGSTSGSDTEASASDSQSQSGSQTVTDSDSDSQGSATGSTSTPQTSTTTTNPTDSDTTTTTTGTDTDADTDATTGGLVMGCQGEGIVGGGNPSLAPVAWSHGDLYSAGAPTASTDLDFDDDPAQGGGFIMRPDVGETIECDIWAQDCPEGDKCMPWANDGGTSWNATRCTPLDPNPAGVGETCIVEGSGVSGVDNCELAAMCWDVDPQTNEGTCVAMCTGSEANPVCPESTMCSISNNGVLILCLPLCNPLVPDDCGQGEGCYPAGGGFLCAPDASGDMGGAGDPCEFLNACDPGNVCVNAAGVPGCAGSAGCCSSTCPVGDDSNCLEGQECVSWFEEGQEPDACLEGVGVCIIP